MQPRLLKHPARLAGASLLRLQDDQRLVALAREGHDPAFAAIVDRYDRQLERYCARLLGPGRAEDAVQQAFVNAHAAMRATDDELALKPWLYRIAHNAALNILRASRDEDEVLDAERPGAVQTAEIVELRERLRETLASIQALPAAQRDALLLRELEGRSHEEIAAALGISEGGARQHLHRARVSLRAAASAITPYPVLARVLSASADEGARGADIVSGAGLGAGAGAIKVAAGVLAAGAIAGGAVGAHHHRPAPAQARAGATHTTTSRSTTATSEANRPPAGLLTIADHQSAGAGSDRGHGRGAGGARGHGRRHGGHGDGRSHESGGRPANVLEDHHGSSGSGDSGSNEKTGEHSGSHDGSGSGSSGSGSSGSGGSDDMTTEASHDGSTTTTTSDGGSSGGSGESSTTTSTTTTDGSGGDGGLSSGSSDATTTDG